MDRKEWRLKKSGESREKKDTGGRRKGKSKDLEMGMYLVCSKNIG